MKGFFQGFNLVRGLILVFTIGAIPMGLEVWEREQDIRHIAQVTGFDRNFDRQDVADSDMVEQIETIIKHAKNHSKLQEQLEGEGLKGQDSPLTYIREIAKDGHINLGRVDIKTSQKDMGPYVDKIYKITPQDSKSTFSRVAVSNFMYKLEADSRRVRVTNFAIDATDDKGRRPKIGELPSDNWSFDCEITIRERK